MTHKVGDTVYTIHDYAVQIDAHEITKITTTKDKVVYYLSGKDRGYSESSIFTKTRIKSHLINELKRKHKGELLQAKKQIEKIS